VLFNRFRAVRRFPTSLATSFVPKKRGGGGGEKKKKDDRDASSLCWPQAQSTGRKGGEGEEGEGEKKIRPVIIQQIETVTDTIISPGRGRKKKGREEGKGIWAKILGPISANLKPNH